eukprot:2027833-Prymnesium_polylepis.1
MLRLPRFARVCKQEKAFAGLVLAARAHRAPVGVVLLVRRLRVDLVLRVLVGRAVGGIAEGPLWAHHHALLLRLGELGVASAAILWMVPRAEELLVPDAANVCVEWHASRCDVGWDGIGGRRARRGSKTWLGVWDALEVGIVGLRRVDDRHHAKAEHCLLYTSDAADDM